LEEFQKLLEQTYIRKYLTLRSWNWIGNLKVSQRARLRRNFTVRHTNGVRIILSCKCRGLPSHF